jgi:putative redox protein
MRVDVTFPGSKRVAARVGSFTIETDQPTHLGGEASAPAPYDLFVASVATCAGIYALGFCQARKLDTAGLSVSVDVAIDPRSDRATRFAIGIVLPTGFPGQYRAAIVRAVQQCKVERTIASQPEFHAFVVDAASVATEREPLLPTTRLDSPVR